MNPRRLRCVSVLVVMLSCAYEAGCGNVALPEPSAALRVVEQCDAPSSDQYFLPEGTFFSGDVRPDRLRTERHLDQMQRQYISRLLRQLNAPSLSCGHDVEH